MNIISVATITLLGVTWAAAGMAAERIPLTLSAAVARATSAHPALRAAQLQVEIAGGQRDASALAPVTTVGLEVENFAGHGSVSGFDAAETTLSIAGKFERGDKSKLRRTAGERRVDLARLGELSIRLEVEAATEQLFYRALAAQHSEKNATAAVAQGEQLLAIVQRRVEIGRSSLAENHTAVIRLTRANLNQEQAVRLARAARNQLAMQWGMPVADFVAVDGNLMHIPHISDLSVLHDRVEANAALLQLAGELELARVQQRLVAAQAKTDLKVSAGIRYLSELNDAALLVGVNVPIGQQKRTLPLSNVARARQAQIPLESEQLRRELFGTLVGLHAEIEQRKLALTAIRDDMVPRADESLELYREGYDLGGFSLLELTEAQNMALGLRQELVAVAAELHELRIELSRLTGDSQTLGGTT
ncbi:MAG TPA: TolC family protein [Gammaproteobacteria bacterium]|jgi:cobalt-zinc-cadmium efflux system outer membrane protein|nr:TolC family protein [Gammaproteobacteria bacterium]MDP7153548.1 TolC family protein [Gammaproteobacteria bacterium]MDP7296036.1 TolC family protein [Gammaproteobacteria bacterium]HJP39021.1 TolC family protein [Gammaproteobacteria bacterium]